MGILNITPDSFSDGGAYIQTAKAVAHGVALLEEGADIIDVGGESTRPGASRVSTRCEMARVLPVVRELAASGAFVSIDTTRAAVAAAAFDAGAGIVNDVSGGLADVDMAHCVAEADVPYIVMHWRGPSRTMQLHSTYCDVVDEVSAELRVRLDELTAAGVSRDKIILDPGLGFAKKHHHNWQLLRGLPHLARLGRPLLVGASRKSFLGQALAHNGVVPPPENRDDATSAVSALAAVAGAYCLRVHRVRPTVDAVRVAAGWGDGVVRAVEEVVDTH